MLCAASPLFCDIFCRNPDIDLVSLSEFDEQEVQAFIEELYQFSESQMTNNAVNYSGILDVFRIRVDYVGIDADEALTDPALYMVKQEVKMEEHNGIDDSDFFHINGECKKKEFKPLKTRMPKQPPKRYRYKYQWDC